MGNRGLVLTVALGVAFAASGAFAQAGDGVQYTGSGKDDPKLKVSFVETGSAVQNFKAKKLRYRCTKDGELVKTFRSGFSIPNMDEDTGDFHFDASTTQDHVKYHVIVNGKTDIVHRHAKGDVTEIRKFQNDTKCVGSEKWTAEGTL